MTATTIALAVLAAVFLILFLFMFFRSQRLQDQVAQGKIDLSALQQRAEIVQQRHDAETTRIQTEAQEGISKAQQLIDQHISELKQESDRIREHYDGESRKAYQASEALLTKTLQELESLRRYQSLRDSGADIEGVLADALSEAAALRKDAQALLEQSRTAAAEERSKAAQKAKQMQTQANALLDQATRDAGRIVEEATKRAEQIGGDAYVALRDKQLLEQAVKAIHNVIEGYGDRYIIPTRSLLDDLAADFGHTEAGEALRFARDHSRRMVERGEAAACDYVEANRKETAIRFVIDAFNGRVDGILTRTKHDNFGTLEQEVRDAFSLVNLNGQAFRDARILAAYLDSRLSELRWAVVVQELKLKEREEQRRIQEQIREEEKVRREQERAIREAQAKEEAIRETLEKARLEADHASAQERAKFDARIAELTQRLAEAEAVKQREISLAQLTRAGNVYIISNIGSFGEEVFKIGMTRRRDPMDRIWELGDASVPFDFDVHAMIYAEDAPALERMLHEEFDALRINKVNYRKEFFRLPLGRIKEFVASKGLNAAFTMLADAHEFRETEALSKMTPEEREKYYLHGLTEGKCLADRDGAFRRQISSNVPLK